MEISGCTKTVTQLNQITGCTDFDSGFLLLVVDTVHGETMNIPVQTMFDCMDPLMDTYTTGATLSGTTLVLTRNDGVSYSADLSPLDLLDTFTTGTTLSGTTLILSRNDGVDLYCDLSPLDLLDTFTTGATLSGTTLVLSRNDGVDYSVDLSPLDLLDTFITAATINGYIITLNRNDGVDFNIDLATLVFTGNTSGTCINDLYVHNLYGCSPINVLTDIGIFGVLSANTDTQVSNDLNVDNIIYSAHTNLFDIFSTISNAGSKLSSVLFVDPNGNDASAIRGSLEHPYQTIEGAWSAATTGDTIHVFPGYYTISNNIAKDAVSYYFDYGAVVIKSNDGAIFDYSTTAIYINNINILGYGSFYHTTTSGEVFLIVNNTNAFNLLFEFNVISSTNSSAFYSCGGSGYPPIYTAKIKGNSARSSGSYGVFIGYSDWFTNESYVKEVDIAKITSTSTDACYLACETVNVKSDYISSTVSYGVSIYQGYPCVNAKYASSVYLSGSVLDGVYYGNTSALICAGGNWNFVGSSSSLTMNGGVLTISNVLSTTCAGGYVKILNGKSNVWGAVGQSVNVSGGVVELDGYNSFYAAVAMGGAAVISGSGTLIVNGTLYGNSYASTPIVSISSGTFRINGIMDYRSNLNNNSPFISKTGGNIILNGSTFIKTDPYHQFINCPSSPQDIMVYTGGVNTNGNSNDLLSSKAQLDLFTVSTSTPPSQMALSGQTFISFVSGNTAIAADFVDQITGWTPSAITAVDNFDGTFNVESVVPGNPYTVSGLINVARTQVRLNSYPITNISGGPILEYSGITY